MSWSFEKVEIDILDDKLLNANEKLILILCKRFKNAPSGIRLTHKYFMDRTGIKDYRTLVKCLDRLVLLGYLGFHQPQKNRANKFIKAGECVSNHFKKLPKINFLAGV